MTYYAVVDKEVSDTPCIFEGECIPGGKIIGYDTFKVKYSEMYNNYGELDSPGTSMLWDQPVEISKETYENLKNTIIKANNLRDLFKLSVQTIYNNNLKQISVIEY